MAYFTTLYSGSSGNCALVRSGQQYLLIDMGKSCRTTLTALKSLDLAVSDCAGILVKHEHSDHVKGLAVLLLYSYVQMTVIGSSVASLQSELSSLESQNVLLTTQYQELYDLAAVKAAAEEAGMTKPSGSQVFYLDLSEGDSAVVFQQQEPGVLDKLLDSLNHGVYAAVEYFS